jgi:uncharacterized protein
LGGIAVDSATLSDRGFQYDRRWMLVDDNNEFLTQREYPQMALLQTAITKEGILVSHKNNGAENIRIPFTPSTNKIIIVKIWDDSCEATPVSDEIDRWFTRMLETKCKLVYMGDDSLRKVDQRYAINKEKVTNFSDAYPLLIIGEESLKDLNSRLQLPLPMNRFRPNIVVAGTEPYEEDMMEEFIINGVRFYGVKLCARCAIPTIDQDTAGKSKEPTKTLASYRTSGYNVYFGQNLLYEGAGTINRGDEIEIIKRKAKPVFNS